MLLSFVWLNTNEFWIPHSKRLCRINIQRKTITFLSFFPDASPWQPCQCLVIVTSQPSTRQLSPLTEDWTPREDSADGSGCTIPAPSYGSQVQQPYNTSSSKILRILWDKFVSLSPPCVMHWNVEAKKLPPSELACMSVAPSTVIDSRRQWQKLLESSSPPLQREKWLTAVDYSVCDPVMTGKNECRRTKASLSVYWSAVPACKTSRSWRLLPPAQSGLCVLWATGAIAVMISVCGLTKCIPCLGKIVTLFQFMYKKMCSVLIITLLENYGSALELALENHVVTILGWSIVCRGTILWFEM